MLAALIYRGRNRMRKAVVLVTIASAAILASASPADAKIVYNTIGATASLIGHGHVAVGTVLIGCTAGQLVTFTLTLTQGELSATGRGAGVCVGDDGPSPYRVVVPARHGDRFTAGTAAACATAVNRDRGVVVDSKEWCRAVGVELIPR
jgi:hypothetical protein